MRRLLALTITVTAMLVAGVPAASAAVTVGLNGGSIVLTGDATSNETYIDFENDRLTIQNSDANPEGITIAASAAGICTYNAVNPEDKADCDPLGDIRATYVGGNDYFRFLNVCVPTATIALGGGTNRYTGQACNSSTITVIGGSGEDTLGGSADGGATSDVLDGAGGDDTIHGGSGDDVLRGGEGADFLTGRDGNDQLLGDGGADHLTGGEGDDTEDGGAGDDVIGETPNFTAGDDQGADDVRGGDGTDELQLGGHTGGMAISLDEQPNDGSAGEGDNLHADIEQIDGTNANDSYSGSAGPDGFNGNSGADVIHGGGGVDTLFGGSDGDQVFGDEGDDRVYGDYGDDVVDGGPGMDSIFGDLGVCCPAYNDRILARDGELDQIQCGAGADTVQADQLDVVAVDGFQACEAVDRLATAPPAGGSPPGTPGTGPGSTPGPGGSSPGVFSFKTAAAFSRAKRLAVKVTCTGPCTFTAKLTIGKKVARKARLGRKARTIGSARGALLAAGTKRVTVKLPRKTRRKMARLKSVSATLKLAVVDSAGATTRKQAPITLRR